MQKNKNHPRSLLLKVLYSVLSVYIDKNHTRSSPEYAVLGSTIDDNSCIAYYSRSCRV